MDAARSATTEAPALHACHTGVTPHGCVWLELVEIDSPDEYVSYELAIPVDVDVCGEPSVDWGGARWLRTDGTLGELVPRTTVASLRAMQPQPVPSDYELMTAWEEGDGPALRKARIADTAI